MEVRRIFYLAPDLTVRPVTEYSAGTEIVWSGRRYRAVEVERRREYIKAVGLTAVARDAVPGVVQLADIVPAP